MKLKSLFGNYKEQPILDQPLFQATISIWAVYGIIKVAILGFEFGQWLVVH